MRTPDSGTIRVLALDPRRDRDALREQVGVQLQESELPEQLRVWARLFVSEATVKTHLLHIYAKLDVNDRAAAVAEAYERGLLTVGRD